MFAATVACSPIFYTASAISRWEGLAFLAAYGAYVVFLCLKETQHHLLEQYTTIMLYGVLPLSALLLIASVVRHWRRSS